MRHSTTPGPSMKVWEGSMGPSQPRSSTHTGWSSTVPHMTPIPAGPEPMIYAVPIPDWLEQVPHAVQLAWALHVVPS